VGDGHGAVCDMFGLINHLAHRKSIARAQIKHATAAPRLQPFQPQNMGIHQIANMHIVANAGAISCIVIRAKDGQRIPFSVDRIQN